MNKNVSAWFTKGQSPDGMEWLQKLIYEIDLTGLSIPSGIYFLYRKDEIQYIGQTVNILSRIGSHRQDKDFDKVFFLPVEADSTLLEYIEMRFIDFYKPPLNKTCRASYHYSAKVIDEALEKAHIKMWLSLAINSKTLAD